MTARVLESLEDKNSKAFAAACESLWGKESPSSSSSEEGPTLSREVHARAVTPVDMFKHLRQQMLFFRHGTLIEPVIEHGLHRIFMSGSFSESHFDVFLQTRHPFDQALSHPQPQESTGVPPPTTLKGAMGSWRPSAGATAGTLGKTRNPPAAVTGVAPWAFQTPKPPTRSRAADLVRATTDGAASVKPPLQSLKRLR